MKKKTLGIIVAIVVTFVAGYNVYTSQNTTKLSNMMLANIEALADPQESGASCTISIQCGTTKASCSGFRCKAHKTYVECADGKGNTSTSAC